CSPPSESLFQIGTTTVTCTATDSRQRVATCMFQVMVVAPPKLTVTRFVAFGDSMTAGEDGNNVVASFFSPRAIVSSPYPSLLRTSLAARYTTQSQIITMRNEARPAHPLPFH